jgi:midasin
MKVSSLERGEYRWGIHPFFVERTGTFHTDCYNFETETAHKNLFRLLRAMQLNRPILLEGSPGVGKTTLVEAMCRSVGQRFVRINLSDQTDMMDLLGANLPSPDSSMGEFVWYGICI